MNNRMKEKTRYRMSRLLHEERIRRKENLQSVSSKTGISMLGIDSVETGIASIDFKNYLKLAHYYGKRFKFTLVDREKLKE